jgi:hypothetical protein
MKTYGEWMYRSIFCWPRHLLEVSGQIHSLAVLPPGKEPHSIHWRGRYEDPRTDLDDMEKWKFFAPTGNRTPTHRSSSQKEVDIPYATTVLEE